MKKRLYLLLFLLVLNACSSDDDDSPINPSPIQLPAPVFSISAGTYNEPQTIEVTNAESDAIIRYAVNDVISNGQLYTSPITLDINGDYTIVAQASKEGFEDSNLSEVTINIELSEVRSESLNFIPSGIIGSSGKRIAQIIEDDGSLVETSRFYYNATNGLLDSIVISAEFENDEIIKLEYQNGNQLSKLTRGSSLTVDNFTYASEGYITSYTLTEDDAGSLFTADVTYQYDEEGHPIEQSFITSSETIINTISYSGDNPSNIMEGECNYNFLNYDDLPYAFSSIAFVYFIFEDLEYYTQKNNASSFNVTCTFGDNFTVNTSTTENEFGLVETYTRFSDETEVWTFSYEDGN